MTTNELIDYISDVLNLSGPEARSRIGRALNIRYKQVTSAIGMGTTRRVELSQNATIGNQFITFTGTEKLNAVYRKVGNKKIILALVTPEEIIETHLVTEPPTAFCEYSVTQNTVTIQVNCVPSTTFTLYALVVDDVSTLTNLDAPALPESFHDVLIHGVLADEYRRKDKDAFSKEEEDKFAARLSDLRMFLAKNAYINVYRGKHAKAEGWWDNSLSTEGQFGIIP